MRRRIRYQALVELVVSSIALLTVFTGVWFLSFLGTQRVKLLIDTRAELEESAAYGSPDGGMSPIRDWDPGKDGRFMTLDDEPVSGDDVPENEIADVVSFYQGRVRAHRRIVQHNIDDRARSPLSTEAADLIEKNGTVNPFENYAGAEPILETIEILFFPGARDLNLEERVLIPVTGEGR